MASNSAPTTVTIITGQWNESTFLSSRQERSPIGST